MVLVIKPIDVRLWVDEGLHSLNEFAAGHVVQEVKHDQGDSELEMNLLHEFVLGKESSVFFVIIDIIFLADEIGR